jgi:hypothetical protein
LIKAALNHMNAAAPLATSTNGAINAVAPRQARVSERTERTEGKQN